MELLEQGSPSPGSAPVQKAKSINIKKLLLRYLRKWPWFLLSMALFYTAAKIYLRYTAPEYYTKTSLKLQESKGKSSALSDLKNLGMGVSGDEELQAETTGLAAQLASSAPLALRGLLDCVNVGGECGIEEGLEYESAQFGLVFSTEDMREGTAAFLEKRKPTFAGR